MTLAAWTCPRGAGRFATGRCGEKRSARRLWYRPVPGVHRGSLNISPSNKRGHCTPSSWQSTAGPAGNTQARGWVVCPHLCSRSCVRVPRGRNQGNMLRWATLHVAFPSLRPVVSLLVLGTVLRAGPCWVTLPLLMSLLSSGRKGLGPRQLGECESLCWKILDDDTDHLTSPGRMDPSAMPFCPLHPAGLPSPRRHCCKAPFSFHATALRSTRG